MYYFCTYFDINYLPRGLCLLESLERHCLSFRLYILCMDKECLEKINSLNNSHVFTIGLDDLESAISPLLKVKKDRSIVEYYYTCGPAFTRYVVDLDPAIDIITYLDADMYFYNDPKLIYNHFGNNSIGVVGHHLPEFRKKNIKQGLYNVGWLSFRRDNDGMNCLEWWRDKCIEWCYERFEDGKYADQLYLDQWPKIFTGFHDVTHHGANVAPWNTRDYKFSKRGNVIFVDDDPLVFYHYHGLKKISKNIYNTNLGLNFKLPHPILKEIYKAYIKRLNYYSQKQNTTASIRKYRSKYHLLKSTVRVVLGVIFQQYIIVKE